MLDLAACSCRVVHHVLCQLLCLGRHTIAGLLRTDGRTQGDWTADYRLYSRGRADPQALFAVVRQEVCRLAPPQGPLVVGVDDSILRKRGRKTAHNSWQRDPLSPPFGINWVLGQRFLQMSLALPVGGSKAAAAAAAAVRMLPVDFVQAPTAGKPPTGADAERMKQYKQLKAERNLNNVAVRRIEQLQGHLSEESQGRPLLVVTDNRLSNRTVLRQLQLDQVTVVGRIRKDAKLSAPPRPGSKRQRLYGADLPTPQQVRQDPSIPWQAVQVRAAGQLHQMKVKVVRPVRWRSVGGRDLLLIVIAPLGYRPRKGSKLLYREPAYLVCTDASADVQTVVQAYVWRWGVEVNFRDEKTLLGIGQAQVRHEQSVQDAPALAAAAYSLLQLAAVRAYGAEGGPPDVPQVAWMKNRPPRQRSSTMRLIQQLRCDCWGKALNRAATQHFTTQTGPDQKPKGDLPPVDSAVLCAVAG